MKYALLTLTAAILFTGCTQIDPNLPQHKAQAEFKESKSVIRDRIVARCANRGLEIELATDTQVVCSVIDTSFGTNMMLSSRYSTTPRTKVRYTIYTSNGKTNVIAKMYSENMNAYGQKRHLERNDQKVRNRLREVLVEMGGK